MPVAPIHQYLPRLVREWDDGHPARLHQAIDGSMVFVDVSGFTKMSERLARHGKVGAEEVTEVIGGTFERLVGRGLRVRSQPPQVRRRRPAALLPG